jgi:hypothetical protein
MASGLFIVLTVRELDQVGEVVSRMARRRDGSDLEPPCSNGVAIVEGSELLGERHRFACRDRVPGARRSRERQTAAQVVVVDVGLEHDGDADPQPLRLLQIRKRIPLRVDHHAHLTVADEVAPVAETGSVENHRRHWGGSSGDAGVTHSDNSTKALVIMDQPSWWARPNRRKGKVRASWTSRRQLNRSGPKSPFGSSSKAPR